MLKGSKSAEGSPNPLADMDPGGPNPLGHRAFLVYLRPNPAAGHLVYLRLCPAAGRLVTAIPKRSKGRLAGNINPLRSASKLFQIAFDVRYSFKFSYSFKQFGVLISQLKIVWFENIKCMTKTSVPSKWNAPKYQGSLFGYLLILDFLKGSLNIQRRLIVTNRSTLISKAKYFLRKIYTLNHIARFRNSELKQSITNVSSCHAIPVLS